MLCDALAAAMSKPLTCKGVCIGTWYFGLAIHSTELKIVTTSMDATASSSTASPCCLGNSRAAQLLDKDPRAFGAAVKQLYLSGPAGGAGLRELLAHNESMETDQPEFDLGRPAPASASGSATPTFGRGARDAAG